MKKLNFLMFHQKFDKSNKSSILITYFKVKLHIFVTALKQLSFPHGKSLERKNAMNTSFFSKVSKWVLALILATLAACGGGGGSTPITPSVTYIAAKPCATGPNMTSQINQMVADGLVPGSCPAVAPPTLTFGPTGLPVGVKVATGAVTISGSLIASSVPGTLKYLVTASNTLTRESGSELGNTSYTGTLVVSYTNAPSTTTTVTYLTDWKAAMKTLVEAGTVITEWTTMNPLTDLVLDSKWMTNLANGNFKVIKTNEVGLDANGLNRNLWRVVYTSYSGANCMAPVYADTGKNWTFTQGTSGHGCFTGAPPIWVTGFNDPSDSEKGGVIMRIKAGVDGCQKLTTTRNQQITCPF